MSREHLGCKSSASILFGTWSLGYLLLVFIIVAYSRPDDLWTSRNSPVSAFSRLTLGTTGFQIWATVSGFVWILGIKIQPLLLAHVLYPLRHLPGPSHKLPNVFLSCISKLMASWALSSLSLRKILRRDSRGTVCVDALYTAIPLHGSKWFLRAQLQSEGSILH